MAYFLAGCAVLVLLLIGGRFLVRTDPRKLATIVRKGGGIAALAGAAFLLMRGAIPLAVPLAVFGLALVGGRNVLGFSGRPFGSARKSPGQKSQVRTDRLEMELDHDSGHMDGKCLSGRFAGRTLSSLSGREVMELLAELHAAGAREAALMEAYLDWRLPNWRDQASADDWRPRGFAEEENAEAPRGRARANRMSAEEAYAVLGVEKTASEEEIKQAHRRLMMKMHPDQGGSTYLAARINEAKEVLLGQR
jgi:DnaJ domain